jgi:hypothetical protein
MYSAPLRRLLLAAVVALAVAAVPSIAVADSDRPGEGWFHFYSDHVVKQATEDALVFPGTTDVSHLHEFHGNRSINENSTNDSLRANPATTFFDDAEQKQHTAEADRRYGNAVWFPVAHQNGVPLTASRITSGYSVGFVRDFANIVPFPDDMNFIAGSSAGGPRQINGQAVYRIECDGKELTPGGPTVAPQCDPPGLRVTIFAGDCWDGRSSAPDHKSHMTYSRQLNSGSPFRFCPASHPRLIPAWRVTIEYDEAIGGPGFTVATGSGATRRNDGDMSRLHVDYVSGIKDEGGDNTRSARTRDCLNTNEYCGGTAQPVPGEGGGI